MWSSGSEVLIKVRGRGRFLIQPKPVNEVDSGWAQTSKGHGQAGCLIHELHCESDTVIYKGDCSTWTVEKITMKGSGATTTTK